MVILSGLIITIYGHLTTEAVVWLGDSRIFYHLSPALVPISSLIPDALRMDQCKGYI